MSDVSLKSRITEDVKASMRAGDRSRLGTLRLIQAAIKQVEVDTRSTLDDAQILTVLDKMLKQRRESIEQYRKASREDLAQQEQTELEIIQSYMPEPLTEAEIVRLLDQAIAESGASTIRDMGKLMNLLRPQVQGRADMTAVSALVKSRLS